MHTSRACWQPLLLLLLLLQCSSNRHGIPLHCILAALPALHCGVTIHILPAIAAASQPLAALLLLLLLLLRLMLRKPHTLRC